MTDGARGLWRSKNDLVFLHGAAEFPMRCLWTNEPVTKLVEMTLSETQVNENSFATSVKQREIKVKLPVSPGWLAKRDALRRRITRILIIAGSITLLLSIIAGVIIHSVTDNEVPTLLVGVGGGTVGGLAILIGAALPFLEGVGADPKVYAGSRFLDDAIIIRRVSPEFLEGLPQWEGATN